MPYQKHFKNNPSSQTNRSHLRSNPTKAEYVLWQEIRKRRLKYLFRRQFEIEKFIVDFYCDKLKLIIEADGPIHDKQINYDKRRDSFLRRKGYFMLRFKNDEILFEREKVIERIRKIISLLEKK